LVGDFSVEGRFVGIALTKKIQKSKMPLVDWSDSIFESQLKQLKAARKKT